MSQQRLLVTGANGFVGRALCVEAVARGIAVRGITRFPCRLPEGVENIVVDNSDGDSGLRNALTGCDAVVHLAARVHMMDNKSMESLALFREVNVDYTLSLARQAVVSDVKRFVFVSSVKVNGEETTVMPFTAFDVAEPGDSYGQSKLEAELALKEFALASGLEVVIVRPPLVYGPGVRANFYKLMQIVKLGVPLPLGSIQNRRSMVALSNLVDLLILCCHHPNALGRTFMVSDDNDVSIAKLIRMLANAMGKRSLLMPIPPKLIAGVATLLGKNAEATRLLGSLQVDISHTKRTLGWSPVVNMQESIDDTVAYFLSHHN